VSVLTVSTAFFETILIEYVSHNTYNVILNPSLVLLESSVTVIAQDVLIAVL
jgi:hypothetical protein